MLWVLGAPPLHELKCVRNKIAVNPQKKRVASLAAEI